MSENHDHGAHSKHGEIHLPPNSVVPVCVAISFAIAMTGLLVGPVMWGVGLVLLIGSLVAWFRGARNEFYELPE